MLQCINAFRGFGLGEILMKGINITGFFGQSFEVRGLSSRHWVITGNPLIRLLLDVCGRIGIELGVKFIGAPAAPARRGRVRPGPLLRYLRLVAWINKVKRPRAPGTNLDDSLLVRVDEVFHARRHRG